MTIVLIPIDTKEINPQNMHINPIGTKKKFSCKIPFASIYSTDIPLITSSKIPIHNKTPPIIAMSLTLAKSRNRKHL